MDTGALYDGLGTPKRTGLGVASDVVHAILGENTQL
ncbi:hypothetical protein AHiyo1_27710 [Arthrobacter sp. Hiyo1]|nr:hypothetical protein AHiyo1_27710 [Arthrobacter sp. Hiyo1]